MTKRDVVTSAAKGCKRCGSKTVAWHQCERGKWYLIEVFIDPSSKEYVASYRDFHSNYCGKPDEHTSLQKRLDEDHAEWREEHKRIEEQRDNERIKEEAGKLHEFARLSFQQRENFIEQLRVKYERHSHNDPTMDYFTDQMRWRAEMAAMEYEISMYEDFHADFEGLTD